MALIGSLQVTGSSVNIVKREARWKDAGQAQSSGSVSLVIQTGDYGNSDHREASGSIIFIGKDGGATTTAGSIVSKPYDNQDLVLSSSQSHADIRFAVNDNGSNFNLMTITSGRDAGGLSGFRGPKVFITDTAGGYNKDVTLPYRGQGLLTVSTQTNQVGIQIVHTGTATEAAFEVKKKHSGANTTSTLFSVRPGETVVNDSEEAYNFRVESDGEDNMLLVDGTNNRVAIGNDAPMAPLDVNNMGEDHGIILRHNDASGPASQYVGLNVNNTSTLTVSGTTKGRLAIYGTKTAHPDAEIKLISKRKADGAGEGDGVIWFSQLAGDGSSVTDYMYLGYDRSDDKVAIGASNSFPNNQILSIGSSEVAINDKSGDINFRVESNDKTHAIFMDGTQGKVSIGDDTVEARANYADVHLSSTRTNTWDSIMASANTQAHMNLMLKNQSDVKQTFVGVAFDPGTEQDADSIGAAIIAERDVEAHADSTKHDTNLIFATSTGGDGNLRERLRITHDGNVYLGTNGGGNVRLFRTDTTIAADEALGTVRFCGTETSDGIHDDIADDAINDHAVISAYAAAAATASSSPGYLTFSTTATGTTTTSERMRIDKDGLVGIGMTPSAGTLDITHSNLGATNYPLKLTSTAGGHSANMIWMVNPDASGTDMPGIGLWHQDDGEFTIGETYTDDKLKIDADGNVTVGADLIVTTDLRVNGNDIQDSGGTSVLNFDGSGNLGINTNSQGYDVEIRARQDSASPETVHVVLGWSGGGTALGGQGAPDSGDVLASIAARANWTHSVTSMVDQLAGYMSWTASENWAGTDSDTQGSDCIVANRTDGAAGNKYIVMGSGDTGNVILNGSTDPSTSNYTVIAGSGFCPATDDSMDCGHSSYRWDQLRATDNTIATSDARLKDNIQASDLGLDFINRLNPVSYKWKDHTRTYIGAVEDDGPEELISVNKTYTRTHYGLVAQDVEAVMTDLGKTRTDFAGFCSDNVVENHGEAEIERFGLRYAEFISPLIRAVQELKTENDSLKARVEALES